MVDINLENIEGMKLHGNSKKNNLDIANKIKGDNKHLAKLSDDSVLILAKLKKISTNLSSPDENELIKRSNEIEKRHGKITGYENEKESEKDPKRKKQLSKLIEEESGKIKELQGQNADAEIKKIIMEDVIKGENLNGKKIHLAMQKINEQLKLKQYANRGFFKKIHWLYPAKNSHATSVKKIKQAYIKADKLNKLKTALADDVDATKVLDGLSNEGNNTQKIYLDDNSQKIIEKALEDAQREAKEEDLNKYLEYSSKTSSMEFPPSMKKSDVIKDACANMGKDAEIKFTLGYSAMGPNEARLDNKALATLIQKRNEGYKLTIEKMEGLTDINIKENETAQQFIDKITSKSSTGRWKRFHNSKLIKGVKYLYGKNRTKTANNLLYNHIHSIRHDNRIALEKLLQEQGIKDAELIVNPPPPQSVNNNDESNHGASATDAGANDNEQKIDHIDTLTKTVVSHLTDCKCQYKEAMKLIEKFECKYKDEEKSEKLDGAVLKKLDKLKEIVGRAEFHDSTDLLRNGCNKDDTLENVNKGMKTFGKSQSAKFLNKDNAKNLQETHKAMSKIRQNAGKNLDTNYKDVLNNQTSNGEKQRPHGASSAENSTADNQRKHAPSQS